MGVSLSNIAGTQLSGLTGRKVKMPYNQMVLSQTPAAESLYQSQVATRQAADQFERSQALQKYIADEQNKEAGKASMISGANTLMSLVPLVKDTDTAKSLVSSGKNTLGKIADSVMGKTSTATPEIATAAQSATTETPAYLMGESSTAGTYGAGLPSSTPQIASELPELTTTATGNTTLNMSDYAMGGNASKAAEYGGLQGSSPTVSAEAPSGALGAALAYIAAAELARGQWGGQGITWNEKTKQQRTVDSPVTTGMMLSMAPGTVLAPDGTVASDAYKNMSALERTAMAPVDYLFGDKDAFDGETLRTAGNALWAPIGGDSTAAQVANVVLNPLSIFTGGGGCIIVTACTGRDSDEVNITRQYRDTFLSPLQLRGYYALADKVVPCMERHAGIRKSVKKTLVDKLIDYGKYRLEMSDKKPGLSSVLVSKTFLALITAIGMMIPRYVRANGEGY